jgi:hypothetical protein
MANRGRTDAAVHGAASRILPCSRAVFTNPAAPPWFNVVLAEPSIKVLGDPPDQAQLIGGVNATWASERSMVEVSPPLAAAPWN